MLSLLVVALSAVGCAASSFDQCDPARHICHGACPPMPPLAPVPDPDLPEGLCLYDSATGACVCWHWNPDKHMQAVFKCDMLVNGTLKRSMCLPPSFCFPPGQHLGCLIIPFCPCQQFVRGRRYGQWISVVANIYRSKVPVEPTQSADEKLPPSAKPESSREFNLKHLLFLLAFVVAPLCCWCLLTFFHEGKCRKKRHRTPLPPLSTESEAGALTHASQAPSAPKLESPPPYDPESSLLPSECGPPPSYDDAVQSGWQLMIVPSDRPELDSN